MMRLEYWTDGSEAADVRHRAQGVGGKNLLPCALRLVPYTGVNTRYCNTPLFVKEETKNG
jgi:hypothetical protein